MMWHYDADQKGPLTRYTFLQTFLNYQTFEENTRVTLLEDNAFIHDVYITGSRPDVSQGTYSYELVGFPDNTPPQPSEGPSTVRTTTRLTTMKTTKAATTMTKLATTTSPAPTSPLTTLSKSIYDLTTLRKFDFVSVIDVSVIVFVSLCHYICQNDTYNTHTNDENM